MRDPQRRPPALPATTEAQLEELGRRISALAARMQAGTEEMRLATQSRVAMLRTGHATTRTAVHEAAARVEKNILQLETRVNIAEHAAAVDLAEDVHQFLGAITAELHSWDLYLERLQVKVATTAGDRRGQAERGVAELRRHRNTVAARAREVTSSSGAAWREVREQIQPARRELESRAAEVEARLGQRSEEDAHGLSLGRGA